MTFKVLMKNLRHRPVIVKSGRAILQSLGLHKPTSGKNQVLREAAVMLSEDISLDYSPRYGLKLFHDRNNPLIARGPLFEQDLQNCLCFLLFLDRLRGNEPRLGDIGANIGLHSFFLKELYPDLEIEAFDPSPLSWKYMQLTMQYNKVGGITLHKIALSDEQGTIDLYSWGNTSSADSLRDTKRVVGVPLRMIPVPMTTLDALSDVGTLTVIKMDCEGAELNILRGMRNRIKGDKPLIIAEFNFVNQKAFGVTGLDTYRLLEELEYSPYTLQLQELSREAFMKLYSSGEENYVILPNCLPQMMLNLK
jgi:FkbM family methyltransferase